MDKTYNLSGAPKPASRRFADLAGPDFYPTPSWATQALIEHEKFEGTIWEPACGDGSMVRVLEKTGCPVIATDLYDRGFGIVGEDFLSSDRISDNIVTNPPFNSAEGFVKKGLSNSNRKLALLLRLAFLEGGNRYRTIFRDHPPARTWVFSERITFYPNSVARKGSGTTAYAWFVWDKTSTERASLRWLPPGYKAREKVSQDKNPDLFK